MNSDLVGGKPLKVLMSFQKPNPDANPFLDSFARSVESRVNVLNFSWPRALFSTYDILHLHWPEQLIRGKTKWHTLVRVFFCFLLLLRISATHIPTIMTVHNLKPHMSRNHLEAFVVRRLTGAAKLKVYLNESEENDPKFPTILHGDYFAWLESNAFLPNAASQEILYFGLVRPYKGVDTLLDAFSRLKAQGWSLTIAGKPSDPSFAAHLHLQAEAVEGVTMDLRHIPDAQLVTYLSGAKIVVLPYREMYNSGALLLALSAGRHVVAPDSPANNALLVEIGPKWLTLFTAPLSSEDIEIAIAETESKEQLPPPPLLQRNWSEIGELYARTYELSFMAARRDRMSWVAEVRAEIARDSLFTSHSDRNKLFPTTNA